MNTISNKSDRRTFLKVGGWTACVGLTAFFLKREKETPSHDYLLRPPGAKEEEDFLSACVRCGLCVQACPEDVLNLAGFDSGLAKGTPYLTPALIACDLCLGRDEMECISVCPTTALQETADRKKVTMGLAVINEKTCLPFLGASCKACWHACPFPHEAIDFDTRGRPVVLEEGCVGCGLCEFACLAEDPAIIIKPTRQIQKEREKNTSENESSSLTET